MRPVPFCPQLKCILKQLFCGLALLQNKKILHRDLKNSNLLLNNKVSPQGLALASGAGCWILPPALSGRNSGVTQSRQSCRTGAT
jgi:serine/threonine protein kinase